MRTWAVSNFKVPEGIASKPSSATMFKTIGSSSPPVLSDVQVNAMNDSAIISWRTDVESSGQLWVKFNSGPIDWSLPTGGLGARPVAAEAAHEINSQIHELQVTGLQPDTEYYYQIASREAGGEVTISDERSFHTQNYDSISLRIKYLLRPAYRQVRCLYIGRESQVIVLGEIVAAGLVIFVVVWLRLRKRHLSTP